MDSVVEAAFVDELEKMAQGGLVSRALGGIKRTFSKAKVAPPVKAAPATFDELVAGMGKMTKTKPVSAADKIRSMEQFQAAKAAPPSMTMRRAAGLSQTAPVYSPGPVNWEAVRAGGGKASWF